MAAENRATKCGEGKSLGLTRMARRQGLFGMVLRPGGTYDSSPAIYRRVRSYTGLRPGGTPEYRGHASKPRVRLC
jgi:hypothetical protein